MDQPRYIDKDRELAEMLASDSFLEMESQSQVDDDFAFAQMLESQYANEIAHDEVASFIPKEFINGSPSPKKRAKSKTSDFDKIKGMSIIAPEWEDLDPTPDLHALFVQYNERFFWGRLAGCEVKWSPRMTLCAGVCSYQGRGGLCSIRLSVPLLKLRPRKDLVETLLHEMIHAYLFVTDGNDNHDGHGPAFHEHMYRINKETGTKISVYHNFHDEVALYKQHWWKCNGPCVKMKPFYGLVKRSMNRAPGPYDNWWKRHQATCGGTFIKIKEPEGYGKKVSKKEIPKGQTDIRSFGKASQSKASSDKIENAVHNKGGGKGNIFGFGGSSFKTPTGIGLQTKGRSGTHTVNPGWRVNDNSSSGQVVKNSNTFHSEKIKDTSKPLDSSSCSTSTSGVKKVDLDDTPEKVRKNMRDFWANKQIKLNDISGETQNDLAQPSRKDSNQLNVHDNRTTSSTFDGCNNKLMIKGHTTHVKCPICDKDVIEKNMNIHLDECLNTSLIKNMTENKGTINTNENTVKEPNLKNDLNSNDTGSQLCPVCRKDILDAELEYHVNMCLEK